MKKQLKGKLALMGEVIRSLDRTTLGPVVGGTKQTELGCPTLNHCDEGTSVCCGCSKGPSGCASISN